MELRNLEQRLTDIKSLTRQLSFLENPDIIFDLPNSWFDEWESLKGESINPGRVSVMGGVKYLYIGTQPLKVSDYVIPTVYTSREWYSPIQGSKNSYNWVFKERIKIGYKRIYEDVEYTALKDIPAEENTTTPDLAPSLWEANNINIKLGGTL